MEKKTKIVCTIGPASSSVEKLVEMMKAGMNVARLNFSHGSYTDHAKLIKNIRTASAKTKTTVALLQDLQGPRIRLGELPEKGIEMKDGKEVIFTTGKATAGKIPVTYNVLHKEVKKGHRILIADGVYECKVKAVKGNDIITTVVHGGLLTSHKGMNFPDTTLSISSLSHKDREDLDFGISQNVDFVALSFVRSVSDVKELHKRIVALEKKHKSKNVVMPGIIVKIEKREAVENFDAILEVADGVMIARGDLGIEMPAEEVPLMQKQIIEKCNAVGKPVIVATQMLESMIKNPRPTRAEVSDVANAVIDKTDAIMLSGESAMGKYPLEAVAMMTSICANIEKSTLDDIDYSEKIWKHVKHDEAIASAAAVLTLNTNVHMIVVLSMKGATARLISKLRPGIPVVATTPYPRVARQLALSWGVTPFLVNSKMSDEMIVKRAVDEACRQNFACSGDQVILIKGHPVMKKRFSHRSIELFTIER